MTDHTEKAKYRQRSYGLKRASRLRLSSAAPAYLTLPFQERSSSIAV
jgi:hypothetical protein